MSKQEKLPSLSRIKKALYADWSLRVRTRDGFRCLLCWETDKLTAHHWYCSDHHAHAARYSVDNGATLCYACHIRHIHTRADYVSVRNLREQIGVTDAALVRIDELIRTDLSTTVLRGLWDAMRARPITIIPCKTVYQGAKVFVFDDEKQAAVVDNVVRLDADIADDSLYSVAAIARMPSGALRYTLKPLENAE